MPTGLPRNASRKNGRLEVRGLVEDLLDESVARPFATASSTGVQVIEERVDNSRPPRCKWQRVPLRAIIATES